MLSRWITASGREREGVGSYLANRCAAVPGDRLRRHGIRATRRHRFVVLPEDRAVRALLYQGDSGLFYPLGVADVNDTAIRTLRRAIGVFPRAYSVMGLAADVQRFGTILRRSPSHSVDYHFMVRRPQHCVSGHAIPMPGLTVQRAAPDQLERLLPLQVAYEREEVLLPGREVNMHVSRTILAESLAHQLVHVADLAGEAVGRVATNARGIGCDQVGGVYVRPDLRKRGIATWLMAGLIAAIESEGKTITLFVKPHNTAAMRLYRGLGFDVEGEFRIDYYW